MDEQSDKNLSDTLESRESQYGPFKSQALLTQTMLGPCSSHKNWSTISADKKEAIHMILHKIARIVNGNPNNVDSWHDIQGYAKLVEDDLKS